MLLLSGCFVVVGGGGGAGGGVLVFPLNIKQVNES